MKRLRWLACTTACALLAGTTIAQQSASGGQQQPAKQQQPVAHTNLKVGDKAPDFELKDQNGKTVKLKSYLGKKNVVLAFYVLAFTFG